MMRTLIVYATKYGSTEKFAHILGDILHDDVDYLEAKSSVNKDLIHFDTIIIGGPIYMGQIRKDITSFCEDHLEMLKSKRLGLFICGMQDEDVIKDQLQSSFPPELIQLATVTAHFGGMFQFEDMSFFDKAITKKIAKISSDYSDVREETIKAFAQTMNTNVDD
ncbi:flavodoxin domain-containing protein [Alkalibacterium sp. f15]|uniref:flavodoxin domain-containing protein n=1 Tax=Alkalibacterium sp. f15 TaxID=3414029 RepID=UPI003BF7E957